MNSEDFIKLSSNLEAMLHESMVKIGYLKGQTVGIYYAESLLHHLLNIQGDQVEQAMKRLNDFTKYNALTWGKIDYSYSQGRYKLAVPPKGVEYVYQRNKENHFLEDLINQLRTPQVTIDDVVNIFKKYSPDVICKQSNGGEFEYSVEFKDKGIDQFIYCFTFDEMGQYYHRFTEFDFRNLL